MAQLANRIRCTNGCWDMTTNEWGRLHVTNRPNTYVVGFRIAHDLFARCNKCGALAEFYRTSPFANDAKRPVTTSGKE